MGGALVVVYGDPRFALIALIGPVLALVTSIARIALVAKKRMRIDGAMRELRARRHRALRARVSAARGGRARSVRDERITSGRAARPTTTSDSAARLRRHADAIVADGSDGTIGIAGDRRGRARRSALASCARSRPTTAPRTCASSVDGGDDWDWAKWLPHHFGRRRRSPSPSPPRRTSYRPAARPSSRLTSDLGDAENDETNFIACGMDEPTARRFARWLARFEDPEVDAERQPSRTVRPVELDRHARGPDRRRNGRRGRDRSRT